MEHVSHSQILRKVPEITALFWTVKIVSTALGESTTDYFVFRINPYIAVAIGGIGLVITLSIQFWMRKYIAWAYWLAVVMVAVFGTMVADVLHVQFGVSYLVSTIAFVVTLLGIFLVWQASEKTLSIHSINSRRREVFYWCTVMTTFALGTAVGDLTAITLHVGYFSSGLLFMGLIAIPAIAHWWFRANETLTFWWAYILTRPFGASFADWTGKLPSVGGLGFGDARVSLVLTVVIVALVGYMTYDRKEAQRERTVLTP